MAKNGDCKYANAVSYVNEHDVVVEFYSPLFPNEKSFLAIELPVSLVPPRDIFDETSAHSDPEFVQDYYKLVDQYVYKIAESRGLALLEDGEDSGYAFKIQGDEETARRQLETAVDVVLKIRDAKPEASLTQVVEKAVGEKRRAYNSTLEKLAALI